MLSGINSRKCVTHKYARVAVRLHSAENNNISVLGFACSFTTKGSMLQVK
jgi:hypothetical protein